MDRRAPFVPAVAPLAAVAALLVAALWQPLAAQATGVVAGIVKLTAMHGAPLATAVYGRRGVPPKPAAAAPETRKVVIYIDGVRGAPSAPAGRARIVQRGERFEPAVTVVPVGATIDFPNDDDFFHNVFSLSRAASFDLGNYASGESRSKQFSKPGIVKVFCRLHAQMTALVVVLDHPYYAVPAESGSFALPPVPAGEYTLVAWHERIGERRERITVAPGATTHVTFTLPVLESVTP